MPYSFVQIERDETKTIQWSVAFLFLLYLVAAFTIVLVCKAYIYGNLSPSSYGYHLPFWGGLLTWPIFGWTCAGTAALTGAHWTFTTNGLIDNTLNLMGARLADPTHDQQRVFQNVVDEAVIATGSRHKIEAWIIPTTAMNAFALQDFEGRSVIGITSGLLFRLNREQLEAVVGHEAGHIAAGDCLETTVTSVLFKVFDNICDVVFNIMRFSGRGRSRGGRGGSGAGQVMLLLLIVLVIAWAFKFISVLGSLFISRRREYRADALSVKLTRNPIALAEALTIINSRWRGVGGIAGENMDAIFILNPRRNATEDSESLFADLFTTHPPVQKRIAILLDMAHAPAAALTGVAEKAQARYEELVPPAQPFASTGVGGTETPPTPFQIQWMLLRGNEWTGPFTLPAVRALDWVTADTVVRRLNDANSQEARLDRELRLVLPAVAAGARIKKDQCPRCVADLVPADYEGVKVLGCSQCGGVLAAEMDVLSIVGKRETTFKPEVIALADVLVQQAGIIKRSPYDPGFDEKSILCPSCVDKGPRMTRRFVNPKYPIEVDKCRTCSRVWFDKDELELLQCMYEKDRPVNAGM